MKRKRIYVLALVLMISVFGSAQQKLAFDLEGAKKQAIQYNRLLKNSAMPLKKLNSN